MGIIGVNFIMLTDQKCVNKIFIEPFVYCYHVWVIFSVVNFILL